MGALGNFNMTPSRVSFLRQMTKLLATFVQSLGDARALLHGIKDTYVRRLRLNARMYVKIGTNSLPQKM